MQKESRFQKEHPGRVKDRKDYQVKMKNLPHLKKHSKRENGKKLWWKNINPL
jgi:hypothetical protein